MTESVCMHFRVIPYICKEDGKHSASPWRNCRSMVGLNDLVCVTDRRGVSFSPPPSKTQRNSLAFFVSFRFLPGKKMGGREQDVDQFLTALRSVCLQNDGTKTGQESDLSNQRAVCPDAPLRSRLHPSITKITISSVISKRTDRVPLSSGSDCFRPAGSEYRENTRNRVL